MVKGTTRLLPDANRAAVGEDSGSVKSQKKGELFDGFGVAVVGNGAPAEHG